MVAGGVESMSRVVMGSARMDADPYGDGIVAALRPRPGLPGRRRRAGRRRVGLHPRAARRVRRPVPRARRRRAGRGRLRPRDRADHHPATAWSSADETIRPAPPWRSWAASRRSSRPRSSPSASPRSTWSITAGNSSQITDGASALLLMCAGEGRGARSAPARPGPLDVRGRRRPAADADRPDPGHPQGPRPLRADARPDRPRRGQRGVRAGAAGLGQGVRRRPRPSSTRAAARSRSATRSAPRAPA